MIVPGFDAKGGIAAVVSGYRGSELEKRYRIEYIETYCDGGKTAKLLKAMWAYCLFLWKLLVFRPDLIHVHSAFGASFWRKTPFLLLGSLLRIPVVDHIHGSQLDGFYRKASPGKRRVVDFVFQKCSAVIALTEQWKADFEAFAAREKIHVVANYGQFLPNCEPEKRRGDTVLFLGFLSEAKGCLDIPQIAARVCREIPEVRFVLAGTGAPSDICRIRKAAQEQGIADRLVFPGWLRGSEKEAWLRQADVFLLPSYTEGMPVSVLEAMGHGIPVVSTTVGGIPALVKNAEAGYLLEPGNCAGMAEAVSRLLQDPARRQEMGETAASLVRENYSLEKHICDLAAVYDSLMK